MPTSASVAYCLEENRIKKPCERNGSWERPCLHCSDCFYNISSDFVKKKFKKILRAPYHPRGYPQRNPIYESIDDTPEPNLCEIRYGASVLLELSRENTACITCHYG